jgi:hypothetical protein
MDKGKNKTSQNSTTNTTSSFNGSSTPTYPDWIASNIQGIVGRNDALGSSNPQSFVAGSNPTLDLANAGAQNLSGTPWDYDAAANLTTSVGQASAPDIASMTRSFMDPYMKQVVDATSADLDRSDNIARQQSDLSNPGAFGGSGIALTKSNLEDALSRARATTLGGLRSQGYSQALQGAEAQASAIQQQQAQRLAAGGQLSSIANDYGANSRANIGTQLGVGTNARGITQDQLSAPLNLASWQTSNLPALLSQFFGQNTTGNSNSLSNMTGSGTTSQTGGAGQVLGDAAMLASMFMSDPRLKVDVRRIGERSDGLGLYVWRYIGKSARRFIGVMADEAARLYPQAVRERPDGYLEVNYAALA